VAGKTLFMRLTLVSECDEATGVHCPGGQSCVEGVCRAPLVNNQTLLPYTKGMENEFACDSGTQFVLSSTGALIPPKGDCGAGQFCQEGTCYANPPGATQAIGVSDWTPRPVDVSTTVHSVFTTPGGDVFGVGEHGIILHAPPGGSTVSDETFDPRATRCGACGARAPTICGRSAPAAWCCIAPRPAGRPTRRCHRRRALSSVWGTPDGELWAVGRKADGSAALVHRLGGNWLADATIHAPGELSAIWGSSRNDVWAVGAGFEILRFDGGSWRAGPTAPAGVTADLLAVGGSGQGDVYFVGRGGSVGHLGADGQIAMQPAGMTNDLYAVWASGPGDVYNRR